VESIIKFEIYYIFFFTNTMVSEHLEYSEEIELERTINKDGSYTYYDKINNLSYDKHGKSLVSSSTKFETLFTSDTKQINKKSNRKKTNIKSNRKETNKLISKQTFTMNTQLSTAVHSFTREIFSQVMEKYDGKVVGSDDMNLEVMMKEFFGDFKPGKSAKMPKVKDGKPKKKRALSGYTYFGQQQKSQFDEHVKALVEKGEEKPKFVTWAAAEWKKLTEDDKSEWNTKAKALANETKVLEEKGSDDQ
jgi:hypothetical protein